MKAMVVRAPGGTDVLKIEQVPDPAPGPKDVVIKVDACGERQVKDCAFAHYMAAAPVCTSIIYGREPS